MESKGKKRKSEKSGKAEKKAKHVEIEYDNNSNNTKPNKKDWKKAWDLVCTEIGPAPPAKQIPKEERYKLLVKTMLVGR